MLTWTRSSLSGQLPVRRVLEGDKGSSDALVLGNVSTRDASVLKLIESVIQDATTEGLATILINSTLDLFIVSILILIIVVFSDMFAKNISSFDLYR